MYIVELYDNDNDFYLTLLETEDLQQACTLCESIGLLMHTKGLVLRRNTNEFGILKDEPFDQVQVTDTKDNNRQIMVDRTTIGLNAGTYEHYLKGIKALW